MTEDDGGFDDSDALDTVRAYYDALRTGDPLGPFFADDADLVKVGVSERLVGGATVAEGLREQTESTSGWTVDSQELRVTERDDHAWFSDLVGLAWTGSDPPIRYEFETRWSGTLERRADDGTAADDGDWTFVGMHVSTAGER